MSCRVFQGECSALSAQTPPACRSSAPRCSCSPHAVNLVGPAASSRRLPLPYRAFAPKPPRYTSSQLYPALAGTVRFAPAGASRREAAFLSALPLFSACAPRSPLPCFPSRVCPARRRLPHLRPEPAHSVSTPSASRLVPGPRVPSARGRPHTRAFRGSSRFRGTRPFLRPSPALLRTVRVCFTPATLLSFRLQGFDPPGDADASPRPVLPCR